MSCLFRHDYHQRAHLNILRGRIPLANRLFMDIDMDDDGVLGKIADGELVEQSAWLALRSNILARLDKIARDDFPIPNLPPPPPPLQLPGHRPASPPLSPSLDHSSSQETERDNASAAQNPEEIALPKQLDDLLTGIKRKMETFDSYPPHTIQRLAELILKPRAHYKALPSYLHAVERVVQVTSGTDTYPLPPPIPDMSSMHRNGEADSKDPTSQVSWSNPTTTAVAVGSDEALGGALLTPIPWLARQSPEESAQGAQIHSEGTQTIDGPNGMGSIETVSVSVNGVPSTGHARGISQGELLRQEQRAGIVPVNQLNRMSNLFTESGRSSEHAEDEASRMDEDETEEVPHARGPEEIGVGDTGPQPSSTTSVVGERGVEMQGIDVEAAVGRKHEEGAAAAAKDAQSDMDDAPESPRPESTSSKREAEESLQDPTLKKIKEDTEMADDDDDESDGKATPTSESSGDEKQQQQPEAETKEENNNTTPEEDKMETTETA